MALTQYLIRYALIIPITNNNCLSHLQFFFLVMSTVFIAAAGYVINDYFDIKVDRLNQRTVIVGNKIKRREAMLIHFIFSGIGIFIGFYLGWQVGILNLGFINLFCSIGLWFYSTHFKRSYLSGNLLISLLSALVIIIIPLYDIIPKPTTNAENAFLVICFYSIFAFLTTFIREVIKDFEDSDGDLKMGYDTFALRTPVLAKNSIRLMTILIIICITIIAVLQIFDGAIYSAMYVFIGVEAPLIYFLLKMYKAKNKTDFHHLSQIMKLIMLTGTLSILVFTLLF